MRKFLLLGLICSNLLAYTPLSTREGNLITWNDLLVTGQKIKWHVEGDSLMLRESVLYATKAWTYAAEGGLAFEEGVGGITIRWVDKPDYFPAGIAGWAKILHETTGKITSVEIEVNKALRFELVETLSSLSLPALMLHEFGHALGLNHSIIDGAGGNQPTMYPFLISGGETLHEDDIAGIKALYPSAFFEVSLPEIVVAPLYTRPNFLKVRGNLVFSIDLKEEVQWYFGDGTYETSKSPVVHRYKKKGTYIVRAVVLGRLIEKTIIIHNRRPKIP